MNYYSSVTIYYLIIWCIFSTNFMKINAYKSENLLQNQWLNNIQDSDLRQAIEEENITEEQLRDPYQFDRLLKRLIFLSPKNLRRFMKVLREWNNLSQRISSTLFISSLFQIKYRLSSQANTEQSTNEIVIVLSGILVRVRCFSRNMFCFRAPQTDLSYYLLLTMKLMFITFGLFPISSKTTQQNSLQLILKNYSILLFNNTSCIQNLTTNPYELANCNEQIIKFLNSTSLGSTACSTCTNNFVCITPANYSILEQIGSYCEQTVINTTYFQISQEKLDQIIKSMDSYGKKLISPDTKKYLGDSVYSPFHIICTICTRNYSMMDKLLKVTNLMNKSNCTDNYHDCEIPLPLLQYKNVLFLCVNCSQNNTITVVQTINSTFSFTQLFDIVMQTSLEVENEFHQLFTPPSVNVTSFCSVDNVALNEGEQNNYTLIRKNASSAYTQIHSKAEQIKLSRRKRNSEPNTNDIYSTMHSHLLPPRNLQIVPLSFGSLNISWIPAKVNEQFITHYELILFSLNEKSDSLYDHCFRTHTRYNHTGHHVYLAPFSSQNRQVFINVT
ncbi:hypothetical protein MN116_002797, partial [Schistosoma mekongi]